MRLEDIVFVVGMGLFGGMAVIWGVLKIIHHNINHINCIDIAAFSLLQED